MEIIEQLKKIRAKNRLNLVLTQADLAALLGVSHVQVSRYESGKQEPGRDVFLLLAGIANCEEDYAFWMDKVCFNSEQLGIARHAIRELADSGNLIAAEEKALLRLWRKPSPGVERSIREMLRSWIASKTKDLELTKLPLQGFQTKVQETVSQSFSSLSVAEDRIELHRMLETVLNSENEAFVIEIHTTRRSNRGESGSDAGLPISNTETIEAARRIADRANEDRNRGKKGRKRSA